ncbi:bifunctional aldolase/short-chain dehydrogenase [Thiohalobacter sp. IOR34]|uniref:bifunctional aldolase/short-chain dehydrogenase n=1 Tax=Thiohalobacter sp. IOR34 TaxID=3057176 RepID=UPI0025AF2C39|nr:bifunctional aldolase/short-chain dehydrogenase [Thiohalobacter sp. IOR34]WJW76223.1 bifunctional aldolase/short-chain dehydrogenase [Thiohalobacter sp. IOR34]
MKNRWNDAEAAALGGDPLKLRVYSSRLLGQDPDLVLHGGGNTSVKIEQPDFFGEPQSLLYVKGSGWDLASIEAAGFPAVKMDVLLKMARLESLSDSEMVRLQRTAMIDPGAPNPSVEAILHALIPFTFVDHTHADAVVTLSNTPDGEALLRELYGERVLILPYVMPGFVLARDVYLRTRDLDWSQYEGIILLHHGVFSFGDDARTSYQRMIDIVDRAEAHIRERGAELELPPTPPPAIDEDHLLQLAAIRRRVSKLRGQACLGQLSDAPLSLHFSRQARLREIASQGPLTPDHVIRTKRTPALLDEDPLAAIDAFAEDYRRYFERHRSEGLSCLDPAPRWAVWPGAGSLQFGVSASELGIIADINRHTMKSILQAERLGGWRALPEKDIFDMEYWELEQAKLKKDRRSPPLQGRIALVTGAASGIGKACVETLIDQGAVVAALDIDPDIESLFTTDAVLGLRCDVTDSAQIRAALRRLVSHFGGLDILVSNAGTFPLSARIEELDEAAWDRSMAINLTSHQRVLSACIPFLKLGLEPAVVFIASKNVPAPGPGASSYSVAKAGMTQLARVAALELAGDGIRVNVLHPDAVFDTAIWTEEVLEKRARHYGLSVEEYKTKNLLKTEIRSRDVAELACALAGPLFAKTTGAQIPIDGGNDRVI